MVSPFSNGIHIRWRCFASPIRATLILVILLDVSIKNLSLWLGILSQQINIYTVCREMTSYLSLLHFETLVLPGICLVYKEVCSVLTDLLLIEQLFLNALTYKVI